MKLKNVTTSSPWLTSSPAICLRRRCITSVDERWGTRTWWEEWKGGKADRQDRRGRLTQTREAPLLCGKCFSITSKRVGLARSHVRSWHGHFWTFKNRKLLLFPVMDKTKPFYCMLTLWNTLSRWSKFHPLFMIAGWFFCLNNIQNQAFLGCTHASHCTEYQWCIVGWFFRFSSNTRL